MTATRQYQAPSGWVPVEANGLTFACLQAGAGPLVLLLHGFPDTAHTWSHLMPALASAGYRVVAPFMRGYAPTTRPTGDDFGAETLGRDVLALMDALGAASAAVVGHDWGAMAAYAAASLAPARVAGLATLAIPHPATLRPSPKKLWGVRHFFALRLPGATRRFAANDFAEVRTLFERWSPGFDWTDDELDAVRNAFSAPGSLDAALGYYRCLSLITPRFLRSKLPMPALVLGGLTDGVAETADFEASRRMFTGRCDVQMLPGGHFLHREHPAAVERALRGWLPTVPGYERGIG